ncbi:hypothetical protein [Streptomyces griseus]
MDLARVAVEVDAGTAEQFSGQGFQADVGASSGQGGGAAQKTRDGPALPGAADIAAGRECRLHIGEGVIGTSGEQPPEDLEAEEVEPPSTR